MPFVLLTFPWRLQVDKKWPHRLVWSYILVLEWELSQHLLITDELTNSYKKRWQLMVIFSPTVCKHMDWLLSQLCIQCLGVPQSPPWGLKTSCIDWPTVQSKRYSVYHHRRYYSDLSSWNQVEKNIHSRILWFSLDRLYQNTNKKSKILDTDKNC